MNNLFWWSGAFVWIIVSFFVLLISIGIIKGLFISASFCNFNANLIRAKGSKISNIILLIEIFKHWYSFVVDKRNGITHTYTFVGGHWRGFANWEIYATGKYGFLSKVKKNMKTAKDLAKHYKHENQTSVTTLKTIINDDADTLNDEQDMMDLNVCGLGNDAYFEWRSDQGHRIGVHFYTIEIDSKDLRRV
jgi:hypothetical protein